MRHCLKMVETLGEQADCGGPGPRDTKLTAGYLEDKLGAGQGSWEQ